MYVGHERFWPRCLRALLYTAGMFAIGMLVLVPIFGMPMNSARGMNASNWYFWATMGYALLMQFLSIYLRRDAVLSTLCQRSAPRPDIMASRDNGDLRWTPADANETRP